MIPAIPNAQVYELLGILPLRLMFHFRAVCLMFNILRYSRNVSIKCIFKANEAITQRELRTRAPLAEPSLHYERSRAAIAYWGPKFWNDLNVIVRNSHNLDEFKQRYIHLVLPNLRTDVDAYIPRRYFYDM